MHVRSDTIKLLKENIGRTFFDINHSKILFDPPLRVIKIKILVRMAINQKSISNKG